MKDKRQIIGSITAIAKRLGRAPSQTEFVRRTGISKYFVLKWFRSWTEAVRAAGLHPSAMNARIEDRALLEDWGKTVRQNGGTLPRHLFRRAAKYNPCTLAKRFGAWSTVPQAFRKFARGKREWTDVVALLPGPPRPAAQGEKGYGSGTTNPISQFRRRKPAMPGSRLDQPTAIRLHSAGCATNP